MVSVVLFAGWWLVAGFVVLVIAILTRADLGDTDDEVRDAATAIVLLWPYVAVVALVATAIELRRRGRR